MDNFLVTRRARITPEQAGLPVSGRRRVPGLRRGEVATLAGISVEYYAQLERGTLRGASPAVLDAIATALRLDDADRAYLLGLAGAANGSEAVRRRPSSPVRLRPVLRWTLDAFTGPATLIDTRTDLIAANRLGRALFGAGPVNFARYVFLDEGARAFFPDWDRVADMTIGNLRTGAGRDAPPSPVSPATLASPAFPVSPASLASPASPASPATAASPASPASLVDELSAGSAEFRRRWESHVVDPHDGGTVRIRHPRAGDLTLSWESLDLRSDDRLTMTFYTAEPGSPSADALDHLIRTDRSS